MDCGPHATLLFSDLDGCLLNKSDYDYRPALPALKRAVSMDSDSFWDALARGEWAAQTTEQSLQSNKRDEPPSRDEVDYWLREFGQQD